MALFQIRIFRFRSHEIWNIGVGIFPEREEILKNGASCLWVASGSERIHSPRSVSVPKQHVLDDGAIPGGRFDLACVPAY